MMYKEEEIKENDDKLEVVDNSSWVIPDCCREGWASCPHVLKEQKPIKRNIGM